MLGDSMDNKFLLDTQEWYEDNHESNDKFLHQWEERQEEAERVVNKSIEFFVNNLGKELTIRLVNIYEDLKNQPEFSWLSNSSIWLKYLEKIYSENKNKISWDLEVFLSKFIFQLNELSVCYKKFEDLWILLKQRVWVSWIADKSDGEINEMDEDKQKTFFGRTIIS